MRRRNKSYSIRKEAVKIYLLAYDMTFYTENHKDPTKKRMNKQIQKSCRTQNQFTNTPIVHCQGEELRKQSYFLRKKKEILPFATTWIKLEDIILSEISQREKNTVYV